MGIVEVSWDVRDISGVFRGIPVGFKGFLGRFKKVSWVF